MLFLGVGLYLVGQTSKHLTNFYMLSEDQLPLQNIGNDNGEAVGLWCLSPNTGSNIGDWYYPDGKKIRDSSIGRGGGSSSDTNDQPPLLTLKHKGRVGLIRTTDDNSLSSEGLYHCSILNVTNNTVRLYIGIYSRNSYAAQGIYNSTLLYHYIIMQCKVHVHVTVYIIIYHYINFSHLV